VRHLAVPVVAALPVVFVDQYGAEREDAIQGRLGETRHLRKLLAPKTSRSDAPRQLISVRHVTPDDLTQEVLSDARLVVVAGIQQPGESVKLLREYVWQGGQLVIAAGAGFDPVAWNDSAWLDGDGILPLPLAEEAIGETPEVAGERLKPFFLSFESLSGEAHFHLAGVAESELRDLYSEPFFFKAVKVDASAEAVDAWKASEAKRLQDAIAERTASRQQADRQPENKEPSAESREAIVAGEAGQREREPTWLVWSGSEAAGSPLDEPLSDDPALRQRRIETLVQARAPRVLARYELPGRPPFLVSRQIGRGEVMFCSTGLLSSWNTLPKTNAVLIFDRLLRGMTQSTLPRRNFTATEQVALPLPQEEQNLVVTLARPGQQLGDEPLDVGYIGPDQRGVTVSGLLERGVYRVTGFRPSLSSDSQLPADKPVWDVPLVVGGEGAESDLAPLGREQFEAIADSANLRWVAAGEEISLAGTAIRGQSSWWWLILVVLGLLILEMAILAWPTFRPQPLATAGS
jgi:hypothetical protein